MKTVILDDRIVDYDDSQSAKDAVFERLIKFFMEHKAFSGESIYQNDGPQIDAPDLLSDIADDILKFQVEWK